MKPESFVVSIATKRRALCAAAVSLALFLPTVAFAQPTDPPKDLPTEPTEPTPPPTDPPPTPPVEPPPVTAKVEAPSTAGLHLSLGAGPSGNTAAGFATQLKVGYRFNEKFRLFFQSLEHWSPLKQTVKQGGLDVTVSQWRIAALNGIGADYFILPKVAVRGAVGLGAELNAQLGDDPNAFGYSFLLGASIELLDGDHHLAIDPFIHMLQYNQAKLTAAIADQWVSRPVIGVTLNWAYR